MIDWAAWSREAAAMMQGRNDAWREKYGLSNGPYHWNLDQGIIHFTRPDEAVVEAQLTVVGSTSADEGTFLWAWANDTFPRAALRDIERVRAFGEEHDLSLLCTAEMPGGRPEALELLAISGRVLDAEGVFIAPAGDVTLYFVLSGFEVHHPRSVG